VSHQPATVTVEEALMTRKPLMGGGHRLADAWTVVRAGSDGASHATIANNDNVQSDLSSLPQLPAQTARTVDPRHSGQVEHCGRSSRSHHNIAAGARTKMTTFFWNVAAKCLAIFHGFKWFWTPRMCNNGASADQPGDDVDVAKESDDEAATGGDRVTPQMAPDDSMESRLCKICMDSTITAVFVPCGHRLSCVECGRKLQECPVCRAKIKMVLRTYDC